MNILNILRKPYLAIFLASLVMFVSCSKYDSIISEEQKFDYSLFEEFKTGKYSNDFVFKFNSKNTKTENFKSVVNKANSNLNVNIDFPEEAYELIEYDADKIYTTSLKNGWLSKEDIELSKRLTDDIVTLGFDTAISNYEKTVLNMSLTNKEFAKKNAFLNVIKSVNYNNPDMFSQSFSNKSMNKIACDWCKCAAASVALFSATMSLALCISIFACGLAIVLVYAASNSFASACLE